jgi:PD-(D/E)XK nuclease superfamily
MTEKLNFTFSPSSLNEMQLCWRRFYYYRKYEPVLTRSGSLDKGTLVHTCLEIYYSNMGIPESLRVTKAINDARVQALETALPVEDIEKVLEACREYFAYRSVDNFKILGVEQPFSKIFYEDDDIRIILEGKVDLFLTDERIGRSLLYDHKYQERKTEPLSLRNQNLAYCYGLNQKEIWLNIVGGQTSLKPHEKFKRYPFDYTDAQLKEWYDNTLTTLEDYFRVWKKAENLRLIGQDETAAYPMNLTSCDKFRGCTYAKLICSSDPETRQIKLDTFYKPRLNETRSLYDSEEV